MNVKILLNRQKDEDGRLAIFSRLRSDGAYEPGDELECVYEYEVEGELNAALERVFSDFNRGSPTFVGDEAYPQRSLSVGDVVQVDGLLYAVAPVGFDLVGFTGTMKGRA